MVFCRRIVRMFILCIVVGAFIKVALNSFALKMASAVLFHNNSDGNQGTSTVRTYNLNVLLHKTGNGQGTSLQMLTPVKKQHPAASQPISTGTNSVSNSSQARTLMKTLSRNTTNVSPNFTKKEGHPNKVELKKISPRKFKPENLMKTGPFKFLSNYKDPCWSTAKSTVEELPIRCLPYFYLIGAPKCGTTDIHRRLVQHPEISKLVLKEPHWINRKHFYGGGKPLSDYLRIFTKATKEIYMNEDSTGYHNKIFGDCSPSTIWDNNYWTKLPENRNLSEPLYTNADYIYHLNPNAKIIVMLRNPVERLYSEYLFFHHGSPKLFHEGVVNAIKYTYDCLKNNTLRHCFYTPFNIPRGNMIKLRIGIYHLHLKEFYRMFPRDQVMVIKLEEFSKNTAPNMQKVFSFLEISEVDETALQKIADPEKHANKRKEKDQRAGEMLPETRKILKEFYRPHNELLTELLGEKFDYNSDIG